MSAWDDCRPWTPTKRAYHGRVAPPPRPAKIVATPKPDKRPRIAQTPELYRGKPRPPTKRVTRVGGHNVKLRRPRATTAQIDAARDPANAHIPPAELAAKLGPEVTAGMVRHWRGGQLPRAYLADKGLL